MRRQHGMELPPNTGTTPTVQPVPRTYHFSYPLYKSRVTCPVAGCGLIAQNRNVMVKRHFASQHTNDYIHIEQEGHYPRCELCGMQVSPYALASGHRYPKLWA